MREDVPIESLSLLKNFDRELVCRQLRYSGMMETINIRRKGYPIRHLFRDFVDRYRLLGPGVGPAHREGDCRAASETICKAALANEDYQIGRTKVFLKDAHDVFLEQAREQVMARKILVLQNCIRQWIARRQFLVLRQSVCLIQRYVKSYRDARRFQLISTGFTRLQSLFHTRMLTLRYSVLRSRVLNLQRYCRGYLGRRIEQDSLFPTPSLCSAAELHPETARHRRSPSPSAATCRAETNASLSAGREALPRS